jgi:hypothetical protein
VSVADARVHAGRCRRLQLMPMAPYSIGQAPRPVPGWHCCQTCSLTLLRSVKIELHAHLAVHVDGKSQALSRLLTSACALVRARAGTGLPVQHQSRCAFDGGDRQYPAALLHWRSFGARDAYGRSTKPNSISRHGPGAPSTIVVRDGATPGTYMGQRGGRVARARGSFDTRPVDRAIERPHWSCFDFSKS